MIKTEKTKMKLKVGDKVIVTKGKSASNVGAIKKVYPKENTVIVEGCNLITKHVKPNPQLNIEGGLVTREAPINASNVSIYNPETSKADKISYIFDESGSKKRVYRSNRMPIDI